MSWTLLGEYSGSLTDALININWGNYKELCIIFERFAYVKSFIFPVIWSKSKWSEAISIYSDENNDFYVTLTIDNKKFTKISIVDNYSNCKIYAR